MSVQVAIGGLAGCAALTPRPAISEASQPPESPEGASRHPGDDDRKAMARAIQGGDVATVERLINAGFDGDQVDPDTGNPFLISALRASYLDRRKLAVVEALLGGGADPNRRHVYRWTALELAILEGGERASALVGLLLDRSPFVDARNALGLTPLMIAAGRGDISIVQMLLRAGADVSARSNRGDTALLLAAEHTRSRIVDLLLRAGANPFARDATGKTARRRAEESNESAANEPARAEAIKLLERAERSLPMSVRHLGGGSLL